MTISVIIPAYQCEDSLRETVSGVLRIGLPLAELLLVDDGSTDGTAKLCDSLAVEYPQVRCIHKPNGGVSSARNLGIEEATGDYLWFVDADDGVQSLPEATLELMDRMRPGEVLFGMEFRYYRGSRLLKVETLSFGEQQELDRSSLGTSLAALFRQNYLSPVWNKLFLRSLLLESGIRFDKGLINYEDLAFSLDVLAVCDHCLVLPDICYQYNTDYDHDRTVDRIARIDAVAANTDLVADRFFALEKRCGFDEKARMTVRALVLQIYLDLFRVKMQTTPLWKVRKHCEEFSANRNFRICWDFLRERSNREDAFCRQILEGRALPIWLRIRYATLRHTVSRIIKPILGRA